MDYDRRFPLNQALQFAGLDPQRFKDSVAKGFYPCAPETIRGSRRQFDEPGLIALTAFAALTEADISHKIAGAIACALLRRVAYDETRAGLISVHYILLTDSTSVVGPWYGEQYTGAQLNPTGADALAAYGVNVAGIASRINRSLESAGLSPISL